MSPSGYAPSTNAHVKRVEKFYIFLRLQNGKMHPFNHGGSSHYATCPSAQIFRKGIERAPERREPAFLPGFERGPYDHD